MNTKTIYTEWLDYCLAAAEEIQAVDQVFEHASNAGWLNFGKSWDLVCSVRVCDPELSDESYFEVADWGPQPTPNDTMRALALSMTSTKIEQILDAKKP